VFEVLIEVNESDPILRPSMTTGNKIITKTISDVTYIPLESVQAGPDSIPFVYMKNKTRQIVVLGESNENNVVIEQGLETGTEIYLSTPEEAEGFKIVGEELIAVIKEKEQAKKAEEARVRKEAEKAREQRGMMGPGGMGGGGRMNITPEMMQQFQNMRGAGGAGAQGAAAGAGARGTGAQGATEGAGARSGAGGTRDTAAMRQFRNMRNQQGGQAAPGGVRDTSARRRMNTQGGQAGQGQGAGSEQAAIRN
jgi:hypothetical protein